MRFQSNKCSCGPASLHNALASLGITRSEDELIKLCKQTSDGTNARGLLGAIKSIDGLRGEAVKWKTEDAAIIGLWYYVLQCGRPVILCVDKWDHWVACTGMLGTRFAVMDSADNRLAIYYTGPELTKRWAYQGGFHGIVL